MLKVLIADDEPDICELINKLIDWKELGLYNIGFAYNGNEALEMILRQKPDIVITDIQMPGQTGLEIIEKIRYEIPATSFVVVSGYQDFEYAQQAIRFGVKEYILKPVNKKELNLILGRIVTEKGISLEKEEENKTIREDLKRKNLILRKNELNQCITDFQRVLNEDVFQFESGIFLGVCVHTSLKERREMKQFQATEVLENIGTRICALMREHCFDVEYCVNDCNVYILMNYDELDSWTYEKRRDILQEYLNEMQIHYPNLTVSMGLGLPVSSVYDARLLETTEHANTLRLVLDKKKVIEYRDVIGRFSPQIISPFDMAFRQKLLQYIEAFRSEEAKNLIVEAFDVFLKQNSIQLSYMFRETLSLIEFIRTGVVGLGMREEAAEAFSETVWIISEEEIHRQLANTDEYEDLCAFLIQYVEQEILYCRTYQENKVSEPIRLAQDFVQKNIHRQISLEEAAEQAYVSPTYFSSLFKKATGMNFSDYLIERRIEEAKKLLKDPAYTIAEISEKVGYADSRHFSKLFQKVVGLKPTAYRKIYL